MKKVLPVACGLAMSAIAWAQSFELTGKPETQRGYVGELLKVPLVIKNISPKTITLIIRKTDAHLGGTQRSFICLAEPCLGDQLPEEVTVRLEPGQILHQLTLVLDAGLAPGTSTVRYAVSNRSTPSETVEVEINYIVEEKTVKNEIFHSRHITIHDIFPNPVTDFATINYKIHTEDVRAKIVIHNILGSRLEELELPYLQTQVKLSAEELSGGIYFYTLYLDNEGVMTRKLMVKK